MYLNKKTWAAGLSMLLSLTVGLGGVLAEPVSAKQASPVKKPVAVNTGKSPVPVNTVKNLSAASINKNVAKAKVKNVIVLVSDGMSSTDTTVARWYKGAPLTLDEIAVGGVKTYSADSIITDSAPAATAFATGYKSDTKFISVFPTVTDIPGAVTVQEEAYKPLATVLEGAKLAGKSTGIIATSNIQHATPAGFSAHWHDRGNYNEIAEQQVYQQIDVVLGGGKQYLLPTANGGKREDGANLLDELKKMGYAMVEDAGQLKAAKSDKIWGAFADDAMAYDFDRDPAKEPSLAEMTQKAVEVLSKNEKGFFLFVESSKVDWAAHANDPIGVISDSLSFDKAVKVAVDYAKKDGQTLVLAFTDHGNGGMSIGSKKTDKNYDKLKLSKLIDPLKKAKLTGEGLESKFNAGRTNIEQVMADYFGITDLTKEEIEAIKAAKPGSMNYAVGPIISSRSVLGWTTGGHTGEDVFMYAFGPGKPTGIIDNTDIARIVSGEMGFNLGELNKKLFIKAEDAFKTAGAKVSIDTKDAKNPVVIVEKGNIRAELPASTNLMKINGKNYNLKSLVIYIQGTVYVPAEAVELFKKAV